MLTLSTLLPERTHESQGRDPAGGLHRRTGHQPRRHHRQRRPAEHRPGAGRRHARAPVGGRRLQPRLRGAGAGGRQPLGPVRTPARPAGRPPRLRRHERRGRPGDQHRSPHRGPGRHGRLRGADLPDDALGHLEHLHRPTAAGGGSRRLGSGGRCRRGARPGDRRLPARPLLLGQRVPRTRAGGPVRRPAHVLPGPRVPRPGRAAPGPPRSRRLGGDAQPADLDDHRGAEPRLVLPHHARLLRGDRGPRRPVRGTWNGAPSTRCSTSASSPTAGSAPPAARS